MGGGRFLASGIGDNSAPGDISRVKAKSKYSKGGCVVVGVSVCVCMCVCVYKRKSARGGRRFTHLFICKQPMRTLFRIQ
jgi:hypothetical protein